MSEPCDRRARIEATLRERLAAVHVEVFDESHLHAGHAGARAGGGHFRAVVVSMRFDGKAPVERQRLVYDALEGRITSYNVCYTKLLRMSFTRVDFPAPDTPVTAVRTPNGSSTSMSARLFSVAPTILRLPTGARRVAGVAISIRPER